VTLRSSTPSCDRTLTEDGKLSADFTIKMGKGYVPAVGNKDRGDPLGTIPVDAIFSPIKRVRYMPSPTPASVNRTDYDKLTMEIWTDGQCPPRTRGVRREDPQGAARRSSSTSSERMSR
jgi:DNA-directed RNA polymerase alpha subunit